MAGKDGTSSKKRQFVGPLQKVSTEELLQAIPRTRDAQLTALQARVVVLERENAILREKNTLLEELTDKDPLTGAYNRQFIMKTAQKIVTTKVRAKRSWGVLMADIDFFKNVNDTYGHSFGDEVLKNVVKMLQHVSRDGDFIVRYGGEEFCVLMWDVDTEESLVMLAERYCKAVSSMVTQGVGPDEEDKIKLSVTISLGACFVPNDSSMELNDVIKRADEALYVAKDCGRNRVEVFVDRRKSTRDRRKSR